MGLTQRRRRRSSISAPHPRSGSPSRLHGTQFLRHDLKQGGDRNWHNGKQANEGQYRPCCSILIAHDQYPIMASATQAAAEIGSPIAAIAIKTRESFTHFLSIETLRPTGGPSMPHVCEGAQLRSRFNLTGQPYWVRLRPILSRSILPAHCSPGKRATRMPIPNP